MRVLHLSKSDIDGGAARGSFWLHEALRARGVDSSMMVARKLSDDDATVALPSPIARFTARVRGRLDELPLRPYDKTDESFWSVNWLPARFGKFVREAKPDILHLHWVGAGFLPVSALKQFNCPVVWTLRDMWGFTGGCHYTAGCERYRDSCGSCPQLRSNNEEDLSHSIWESKSRQWRDLDLSLVPISGWLGDCARESSLFSPYPIEVIPNGLDLGHFVPSDKMEARRIWNLPEDRKIVVYGAVKATQDRRKGFPELLAALKELGQTEKASSLLLVVFGDLNPGDVPDVGIETRYVGYVDDDRKLSLLYSAADAAVMPSLQEAFGKTIIEAMACGTPVVAFASGGPLDIIEHQVDGYLAEAHCSADLARGIVWCLDELSRANDLGARVRAKVEAEFDIAVVADRYRDLYERILARAA
ncbi:MAG TPA: glycosyltransferase family 4 protein [Parvibaculum sp.]|jgi:glycosyltransferase involved in cell wall biosynthesis